MSGEHVQAAVVGMGDIGRGWASLLVASGWPVSLYDTEAVALKDARDEVSERARALIPLEVATSASVDRGIAALTVGRSLLHACGDAEWVIEAVREDLRTKQKVFEGIESVAGKARVVSTSTGGFAAKDVAGRCLRQERCLVVHPLNPVELIPLVEVAASPYTDYALVELVKGWLRALGRIPVMVNKQVPGRVVNRIAAAVWRECIDLVLKGVIDVDDLDRAVSLGPALGWAAAGPHLTYHLAAGKRGVQGFLQHLLQTFETTWVDLACWSKLSPEEQHKLTHAIERTYNENIELIRSARDRRLAAMLQGMEHARLRSGPADRKPESA
ncbi:MAG: 3-hydroxyacyl-CoA dehydrogenase NAD-binding domain-containing protein [Gemmatimonadales bacterium]